MKPSTYAINNSIAVNLTGEFDAQSVKNFRDQFESYSKKNKDVVFDLNNVYFIDSSAIGVMVYLYKRLIVRGYQLSIIGAKGQPWELFKMLHLNNTIHCYQTVDEYIQSYGDVSVIDFKRVSLG